MKRTVTVAFFDLLAEPMPGLTPTFSAYKTLAGVNISERPTILDLGDGLYGFELSAADDLSGVAFMVDGGEDTLPRYFRGQEDPASFLSALVTAIRDVVTRYSP